MQKKHNQVTDSSPVKLGAADESGSSCSTPSRKTKTPTPSKKRARRSDSEDGGDEATPQPSKRGKKKAVVKSEEIVGDGEELPDYESEGSK